MRYVVAGTGYTGSRVLAALPPGSAIGLSRSRPDGARAEVSLVDFDDPGLQTIVLPAPYRLLYTVPPPQEGDGDPRLDRLLAVLETHPSRIVYLSTSGVYGDQQGERVRESDPPRPETPRARRRLAAEALLDAWCRARTADLVILRVPGIYGPGRLGIERLAGPGEVLRDEDAGPGNRIHVDDLADCCVAALTGDVPAGVYNVGDGNGMSSSAFSRAVARLAGLPAPRDVSRAEAEQRWSPMRLSFARESRRLDTTKMRGVLGVAPRYEDPEDGIRASLAAQT